MLRCFRNHTATNQQTSNHTGDWVLERGYWKSQATKRWISRQFSGPIACAGSSFWVLGSNAPSATKKQAKDDPPTRPSQGSSPAATCIVIVHSLLHWKLHVLGSSRCASAAGPRMERLDLCSLFVSSSIYDYGSLDAADAPAEPWPRLSLFATSAAKTTKKKNG